MKSKEKPTFEEVLQSNKESIFRICNVYAIPPIGPEDLFQEATFQLWKAFPSFKGKSSINTWVYRIALNVCMRYKTQLEKRNEKIVQLESIQFQAISPKADTIEQEKHHALNSCIRSLSEIDQSIVALSLDGLSYREIAKITELTENHIAVKMKRLRKVLLNCITTKLR